MIEVMVGAFLVGVLCLGGIGGIAIGSLIAHYWKGKR